MLQHARVNFRKSLVYVLLVLFHFPANHTGWPAAKSSLTNADRAAPRTARDAVVSPMSPYIWSNVTNVTNETNETNETMEGVQGGKPAPFRNSWCSSHPVVGRKICSLDSARLTNL